MVSPSWKMQKGLLIDLYCYAGPESYTALHIPTHWMHYFKHTKEVLLCGLVSHMAVVQWYHLMHGLLWKKWSFHIGLAYMTEWLCTEEEEVLCAMTNYTADVACHEHLVGHACWMLSWRCCAVFHGMFTQYLLWGSTAYREVICLHICWRHVYRIALHFQG